MNQDKWDSLVVYAKEEFDVEEHKTEEIMDGMGSIERIVFNGPLGKIMLEREKKPLVTGRKVIASKRIGSDVSEELEYSDSESVDTLFAYKWNENMDDWEEMDADKFADISN
ncbi:hypothetical protein KKB10_06410 [Patescibacteria group bacterium]|nr:hypothetical protein [Patescibacteria group bacterium]MBU2229450.1 hypothetical protein [Patescibacteria group bacterium]